MRKQKQNKHIEKSEKTIAAMLEAGTALFAKDGYEKTSIEAIMQAIGYTKTAFHRQSSMVLF